MSEVNDSDIVNIEAKRIEAEYGAKTIKFTCKCVVGIILALCSTCIIRGFSVNDELLEAQTELEYCKESRKEFKTLLTKREEK